MPYRFEDREKVRTSLRSAGLWGHVCWFLGIVFAIIGIIAAAMDAAIGLGATNWLLLVAVALLLSVTLFIGWAVAWYLQEKK
jgi:ABC-type xylose transport system permease subunit